MEDADRDVPGVDVPVLETEPGHRVVWTAFAVVSFLLGVGFLALDRPWIGAGHVALAGGGLWRASNPV